MPACTRCSTETEGARARLVATGAALATLLSLASCAARAAPAIAPGATGRAGLPPRSAPAASDALEPVELLVLAPHPDDEVLMAGGVLYEAVRAGRRVAVAVMTNGDATCERDGHARQGETVAALGVLGVPERAVFFLGYPDGHLAQLGATPLPPVPRRGRDGRCVRGSETYAERGHARRSVHALRSGREAAYTAAEAEADLRWLLERLRPREVYVAHPADEHPDHAMTYAYLRRALEGLAAPLPTLHRALVHRGPCWPNGRAAHEPCPEGPLRPSEPTPPLPEPLGEYLPTEVLATPASMSRAAPGQHVKLVALAQYRSQYTSPLERDWLASFVRADEVFYVERLERAAGEGAARGLVQRFVDARVAGLARTEGSWQVLPEGASGARRTRRVAQRLPLELTARARYLPSPSDEGVGLSVEWLVRDRGDGPSGHRLRLDAGLAGLRLLRFDDRGERSVGHWHLPHDARAAARREGLEFAVRTELIGAEAVLEHTVRWGGAVLGVAIDPLPWLRGERVEVESGERFTLDELRLAPAR